MGQAHSAARLTTPGYVDRISQSRNGLATNKNDCVDACLRVLVLSIVNLPCRLSVELWGVEFIIHHNSYRYDHIGQLLL